MTETALVNNKTRCNGIITDLAKTLIFMTPPLKSSANVSVALDTSGRDKFSASKSGLLMEYKPLSTCDWSMAQTPSPPVAHGGTGKTPFSKSQDKRVKSFALGDELPLAVLFDGIVGDRVVVVLGTVGAKDALIGGDEETTGADDIPGRSVGILPLIGGSDEAVVEGMPGGRVGRAPPCEGRVRRAGGSVTPGGRVGRARI